jgi:hypothetical protein
LNNTQTDCTGENKKNTKHKAGKTQKKRLPTVEEKAESTEDGGAWMTRTVTFPTQL